MDKGRYRADIDGLRAIAVLCVIAFHAFPHKLPGGFIGVDVFFVISGFLITSIIANDLERDRFSVAAFYNRRIKRIFPSLVVVMAATLAFGWYVLLADEYRQLGKHIAAGAGFVSNLILWSESGYFDRAAETKLMLHLWSLAIEEQFYLLWPVLLSVAWKRSWSFAAVSLIITVVSFGTNVLLTSHDRIAAFYLPMARFWELMAGALLACAPSFARHSTRRHDNILSVLGVIVLAIGLALTGKAREFPGWWALLPTVGTFLIIAAGPEAPVNRLVLSRKFLVAIGLISYPLYLWHWPLLTFARIVTNADEGRVIPALIVAAFALAWLTYRFVEMPVRFGAAGNRRPALLLGGAMLMLLMLGVTTSFGGIDPRNSNASIQALNAAIGDWEYPSGLAAYGSYGDEVRYLRGGDDGVTLLFGDSHIEQYSPRVRAIVGRNRRTRSALFVTRGGCPPIPNISSDASVSRKCGNFVRQGVEMAKREEVRSIVIGACWWCYLSATNAPIDAAAAGGLYFVRDGKKVELQSAEGLAVAISELEEFIKSFRARKTVYVVLDNPMGAEFDPRSFFSGSRFGEFEVVNLSPSVPVEPAQLGIRKELIAMAQRAGAIVLDPFAMLCHDDVCDRLTDAGMPIYKDSTHMRPFFVRAHATFLDGAFALTDGQHDQTGWGAR